MLLPFEQRSFRMEFGSGGREYERQLYVRSREPFKGENQLMGGVGFGRDAGGLGAIAWKRGAKKRNHIDHAAGNPKA